jgi:hypothetical protein
MAHSAINNENFLLRCYSTSANSTENPTSSESKGTLAKNHLNENKDMIIYDDMLSMKRAIIEENTQKSGIYLITNKSTGDFYIGQAGDLAKRYKDYTNPGYLNRINDKVNSIIGRALKKYGYLNFTFTVLEYCEKSDLNARE